MGTGMDFRLADSLGETEASEESYKIDYGPWMLVLRRRGCGGGRGGAGGPASSGSRAVHASSRDHGYRLPNVSIPKPSAACATRDGSSLRGRGGSAAVRAHVTRAFNVETAPSLENAPLPMPLVTNPVRVVIVAPLEPGPKNSLMMDASLASSSKETLSLVLSQSPKGIEPPDMSSIPISSALSKGKKCYSL